jgi:GNAT superfamily N-acetyltransferase
MTANQARRHLDAPGRLALARALGDTPETVISVHLLRRGLCRALVLGPPDRPRAAILQPVADPTEPTAFGGDPAAFWDLLRWLEGWTCVNVPCGAGPGLATLIAAATGRRCRLSEDVYHALGQPVTRRTDPSVRRLTSDDAPLLDAATRSLGTPGWNWGGAATMLTEGIAAGAIAAGELVAIAYTSALSDRHADVGVATLPDWRGRGLAMAAAALVCTAIQAAGRTPVWSTGVDNLPSLRVARKLGFDEVLRRVYVIPA